MDGIQSSSLVGLVYVWGEETGRAEKGKKYQSELLCGLVLSLLILLTLQLCYPEDRFQIKILS